MLSQKNKPVDRVVLMCYPILVNNNTQIERRAYETSDLFTR